MDPGRPITDLAAELVHQRHDGGLEEAGGRLGPLGDLRDAQTPVRPHLLQHGVRAAGRRRRRRRRQWRRRRRRRQ